MIDPHGMNFNNTHPLNYLQSANNYVIKLNGNEKKEEKWKRKNMDNDDSTKSPDIPLYFSWVALPCVASWISFSWI